MSNLKRTFLTLDDRVKVIKFSESGKSSRAIAAEMGIGRTQVQNIVKRKCEVMDEYHNNANVSLKRTRRATTFEDVNELCVKWFSEATGRKINVSGPLLQEKALKFAADLGVESFKASNGWLNSFLKRNNIVFKTMSGERGAVNRQVVTDWKAKLPSLLKDYEPRNIFNMDETGLFFRDTTKATYFKKGEDCAGGKRSKDRLTVALCASMTGEKIIPLVIGKSRKPRCFSKVSVDSLPVMYRANKKAWMTGILFEEWLRFFDRKMKGRKVLLFVDNAPSHSSVVLKNVTVQYLPANTTSLCQPMDGGIIQTMKLKYRRRQLQNIIGEMDRQPAKDGWELLKSISVLDAIYWIAKSWDEVEGSTIVKCFAGCGFVANDITEEEESGNERAGAEETGDEEADDYPLSLHKMARNLFGCEFQELLDIDKHFVTCDTELRDWDQPASDILKNVRNEGSDDDDESEEDRNDTVPKKVCTVTECLEHVNELKNFASFHGKMDIFGSAIDIGDMLVKMKMNGAQHQPKISDYFNKK